MDDVPLPGSSINYATGAIVLAINEYKSIPVSTYKWVQPSYSGTLIPEKKLVFTGYANKTVSKTLADGSVSVKYLLDTVESMPATTTLSTPEFKLALTPQVKGVIAPGSLRFRFGGSEYIDRNGVLYRNVNNASGSGIVGGSVNYVTGDLLITSWASGAPAFSLIAGIINPGTPGVMAVQGHVPSAPIKPQSFYVSGTTLAGSGLVAS